MLHIVVSGEQKVHRQTLLHRIYFALVSAGIPVSCEEPPPPELVWPSADVNFVNWASRGQAVHLSETTSDACDFTMTLEMEINEEDLQHEPGSRSGRALRDSLAAAAAVWADDQTGSHDYIWAVRDNRTGETVQIDTENFIAEEEEPGFYPAEIGSSEAVSPPAVAPVDPLNLNSDLDLREGLRQRIDQLTIDMANLRPAGAQRRFRRRNRLVLEAMMRGYLRAVISRCRQNDPRVGDTDNFYFTDGDLLGVYNLCERFVRNEGARLRRINCTWPLWGSFLFMDQESCGTGFVSRVRRQRHHSTRRMIEALSVGAAALGPVPIRMERTQTG